MYLVFEGAGMHSGNPCRIEVEPLPKGKGRHIHFDGNRKHIDPWLLHSDRRCSEFLGIGPLEHLAAALLLAGWSDWCLHVQGGGVPLFDGSASEFRIPRSHLGILEEPFSGFDFQISTSWGGHLVAKAADSFRVISRLSNECWSGGVSELPECLSARTFITIDALVVAQEAGLLLGCKLDQGRILGPAKSDAGRMLAKDLGLDPDSKVLWGEPKMEAELAAHKVLDLVGDLSLWIGVLPALEIDFEQVGHEQFHELGRALLRFVEASSMS